jgi:hypothetical protein
MFSLLYMAVRSYVLRDYYIQFLLSNHYHILVIGYLCPSHHEYIVSIFEVSFWQSE